MKKSFQQSGQVSLVQFETLAGQPFGFLAGAPAIERGDLVMKETGQEGTVGKLLAINHTRNYYLLTDMDLLKGARQNRVINHSVLIPPHTKREVEVSCVERTRWSDTAEPFSSVKDPLDLKMRFAKAAFLRDDDKENKRTAQSKLWSMISQELRDRDLDYGNEDYFLTLSDRKAEQDQGNPFTPSEGSNALAVFAGKELLCFDVFGNREVYPYYFGKLSREAQYYGAGKHDAGFPENYLGEAEAFYRLEEILDGFLSKLQKEDSADPGDGERLRWSGMSEYNGFELTYNDYPVHMMGSRFIQ
jgi:hypothetical protein